jgi:hypothetical protein
LEPQPDTDADVTPNDSKLGLRPGATLGFAATFGDTPNVALVVETSFAFVRTRYELDTATGRELVGRAAPVSPSAGLELGF